MLADLADDLHHELLEAFGTDVSDQTGRGRAVLSDVAAGVVEVRIPIRVFLARGLGRHEIAAVAAAEDALEEHFVFVSLGARPGGCID